MCFVRFPKIDVDPECHCELRNPVTGLAFAKTVPRVGVLAAPTRPNLLGSARAFDACEPLSEESAQQLRLLMG
jgi:hypothetical protein